MDSFRAPQIIIFVHFQYLKTFFIYIHIATFTCLNIKNLQSSGNLNILPGKTKNVLKSKPKISKLKRKLSRFKNRRV